MDYIVPDLFVPHLKLVFCGTAPSAISAREKAYYANPGNQFWKVLYRVGLTPTLFRPQDFPKLLALGIGMTDVCKTASGNDDELPEAAIQPEVVKKKIQQHQPQWVAFTSKYSASIYFGRNVEYGVQPDRLGRTQFYVCCSTSGRARRFWREEVWQSLAV